MKIWSFTLKGSGGHPLGHIISRSYRTYKIRGEVHNDTTILNYLTMIDHDTGWSKIAQYNDK